MNQPQLFALGLAFHGHKWRQWKRLAWTAPATGGNPFPDRRIYFLDDGLLYLSVYRADTDL